MLALSDITVFITTAFGGVLVFGALDHSQIDAIDVSECAIFCIISHSYVYVLHSRDCHFSYLPMS